MADEKLMEILWQGAEAWNRWRAENNYGVIDLRKADLFKATLRGVNLRDVELYGANIGEADLSGADLSGANLCKVNLEKTNLESVDLSETDSREADLRRANLKGAYLVRSSLIEANMGGADLRGANLSGADLVRTNLREADLREVDLSVADLSEADLVGADLRWTNLVEADLRWTNLIEADLHEADLRRAKCGGTIFANVDLSLVHGLTAVTHTGRSTIGIDTLFRSKGKIPDIFLRGCGVPESLITFLPSLMEDAIQFYSCFISYSHADRDFARRLHDSLQGKGIRCWLDEHQLNPGDPLHPTIYEAIRLYDKIVLCCSETAMKSWWVEKEFSRGVKKEEDYRLPLIIPLDLDGYLFSPACDGWVADELRQRLVADFKGWKDHDVFEAALPKVVNALREDGGKPPPPVSKLKPRPKG